MGFHYGEIAEPTLKIALVQTNPVIGDFTYNCKKILSFTKEAERQGCRLAIFPEMAISGYPPQDLLELSSFVDGHRIAVENLIENLPNIDVLFGCFEKRSGDKGKPLYNSAVVVRDGKIIYRARKQLLPTYDVFDETRYFEPGPNSEPYEIDGLRFGVTVCEDIWHHDIGEYEREPVDAIFGAANKKNINLHGLINISASPFQRHKEKQKHELFRSICHQYNTPLLYINQVGGQDTLLFDGRSLVMNEKGVVTAKLAGFKEDLTVIESKDWCGEIVGDVIDDEIAAIQSGLVMGVRDYLFKCGFTKAVLGLSGGIDSALTASIAVEALGADNVLGVALPSPYSSADSLEDAEQLANALGCRFEVIPIGELFSSFKKNLSSHFKGLEEDITEQNLQARIRGNLLMALSNKFGSLLLTTGNKSEMAVGYCTLYGDMSGGLAVISDVPKQLVYELARYVNRNGEIIPNRTLSKAPTAELKPGQYDQDDLPAYDILDQVLELHLEKGLGLNQIVGKGYGESLVRDVLRRVRLNEYKRKQAPMGLKVTSKAFGFGRRFPNVQNFRE